MEAHRQQCPPCFLVPAIEPGLTGVKNKLLARVLASSFSRSLSSGILYIANDSEDPLFKLTRKNIEDLSFVRSSPRDETRPVSLNREAACLSLGIIDPDPDQWVVFLDAASLILRNIDHLFPPAGTTGTAIDFLWASQDESGKCSRGFWAIRGKHLERFLKLWDAYEEGFPGAPESFIWEQVVRNLKLRKKQFEGGEVLCPNPGSVDWARIPDVAVITVPDWPQPLRQHFLRSVYWETYFGDPNGTLLQVLDA
jgi:hypothetical protein